MASRPADHYEPELCLTDNKWGTITVAGDDPMGHATQLRYTSMHADFMNGWDQAVLTDLVTRCIKNIPQGTPEKQKPDDCQDPAKQ